MGLFRKKKEIVYDEAPASARFVMQVEDALYISGRGTVVIGEIVSHYQPILNSIWSDK